MRSQFHTIFVWSICAVFLALAQPHISAQEANSGNSKDAPAASSPGEAYLEAMRPVEITRRSIANWSDIEQSSLAVAVKNAAAACATHKAADYSGDSLIDLSRLCTLGLGWPTVIEAADRYIKEKADPKSHLAEAYAAKINAELNLKDRTSALADAYRLLDSVEYRSISSDATNQVLKYVRFLWIDDAISLASKRQELILTLLKNSGGRPLEASTSAGHYRQGPALAEIAVNESILTVGELYREGLALAELQQLAGNPAAASEEKTALDRVVPLDLQTDDAAEISGERLRYDQLGQSVAHLLGSQVGASSTGSRIPNRHAITLLLLFPDWCAQGIRLAQQVSKGGFSVEGHQAYMYSLLVQTMLPKDAGANPKDSQTKPQSSFDPALATDYLKDTNTLVVDQSILTRLDAVDVPLLIIADPQGIVRLITRADEDSLQDGNEADSATALIGKHYPVTRNPHPAHKE